MLVIPNRVRVVVGMVSALALVAGLLTVALLSKPAQAQAENFRDSDRSPTSGAFFSCTGELIFIEGTSHLVAHTTIDGNGGSHTRFHQNVQGQGEGAISGTKYVYNDVFNFDVNFTGDFRNFTNTGHFKLISQGSATDDIDSKLLTHVTVNDQGEITATVFKFEPQCT